MTDLLGTPSLDTISRVRNDKARKYLSSMRKKQPVPLAQKFPNADPLALKLLERLLAFDPKDRPTAEEALADPYFKGLAKVEREPSCQPITKMEFEFERRRLTKDDIRELIFREILEYHPQLLKDYVNGTERTHFLYPSAVDQFRKQFAYLEENGGKSGPVIPLDRKHVSLPRSTVVHSSTASPMGQTNMGTSRERQGSEEACKNPRETERSSGNITRTSQTPQRVPTARPGKAIGPVLPYDSVSVKDAYDPRRFIRNPVLTPQPSAYCFHSSSGKLDNYNREPKEAEREFVQHKPPQPHLHNKMASDIALEMGASPFYLTGTKTERIERDSILEASLVHAKSPYNGLVAAATGAVAHRKVGAVQFGMTKMY